MSKRSFNSLFTILPITILLFAVAGLAGCSGDQRKVSAYETQQPSPWKMALSTEPSQPKYGEDTMFRVSMKDDAGKPITGAKVEADLKMRSHDMGKNVVSLTDNGQGMYEGKGKFTMAGPWDVVVIASQNGKSGAQTFNVVARKD